MEDYIDHKQQRLRVCKTHWVMNSNEKANMKLLCANTLFFLHLIQTPCIKAQGSTPRGIYDYITIMTSPTVTSSQGSQFQTEQLEIYSSQVEIYYFNSSNKTIDEKRRIAFYSRRLTSPQLYISPVACLNWEPWVPICYAMLSFYLLRGLFVLTGFPFAQCSILL